MPPLWLYTWPVLIIVPLSHDQSDSSHWCWNQGSMATGDRVCLPEHLDDGDARSWFKRYKLCADANEWNVVKKLLRLPTLFKGRAWAIFESLGNNEKDTYAHLQGAMTERLNPDTDENRMVACEQLMLRRLEKGSKVLTNLLETSRECWTNLLQASPWRYARLSCGSTLWIPYQRRSHSSSRYHQRGHMRRPFQRLEKCCWSIAELIDITQ